LTLVATVIEGDFTRCKEQAATMKHIINDIIKKEKLKGFSEVIVSKELSEGLSYL